MRPLFEAFKRGRARPMPANVRSPQTDAVAHSTYDTARALIRGAASNHDLLTAAEHLGFVHLIATLTDNRKVELEVVGLLGHAYRGYDTEDRDAAKTAAHDQLIFAADRMQQLGLLREAAIEKTNAATALLEKSAVTGTDLEAARDYLAFSREHKNPNTIDWAYTEFATGIYHIQRPATSVKERVEKLAAARSHMDSALAVFEEHHEQLSVVAASEYGHLLVMQFEAATEQRIADSVTDHIDELPVELREIAASTPLNVGGILLRNPVVAGLAETPPWLVAANDSDFDEETAAGLIRAASRIESAFSSTANSDRSAIAHAQWWLARINWELDRTDRHLAALTEAVANLQTDCDKSLFIERGIFASWSGRIHLGVPPAPALASAIASAYIDIAMGDDAARIERFVRSCAHQIRFMACSLADEGLWEDAANVLETTRLLIYGPRQAITSDGDQEAIHTSAANWVYVTHSPEASYVIVCGRDNAVSGRTITSLSGRHLVQSALALPHDQLGLLTAQWASMTGQLTNATSRAIVDLVEIRDAILDLVPAGEDIFLIPSGIYAALPVAAALMDVEPNRHGVIATVPARQAVSTDTTSWPLAGSAFHGLTAANPDGAEPLPHARAEVHAIANYLSAVFSPPVATTLFDDITKAQFQGAASATDLLHFSGHSYSAAADPLGSALVLQDSHFAVGDILGLDLPDLKLLTLSSCQSSTASITDLASEYLGIHSAFLYAGCRFAIGTLWPVFDVVAALFMNRFYWELASRQVISLRAIYESFRASQLWMKRSTARELESFAAGLEPSIELPSSFAQLPNDVCPFDTARAWAPFHLTVRSL